MVYVPIDNFDDTCISVLDKDTLRAINVSDYTYTDYFVNSHYLSKTGVLQDISSYDCIDNYTNQWYYRNDVSDIFIMCFIGALFFVGIPLVIFSRMFPRFKR